MSDYYCTGGQTAGVQQNNCGCGQNSGCGSCQQSVSGVQDSAAGTCACRSGMVQALQMLLRSGLRNLVDFTQFAFVTERVVVGANLAQPDTTAASYDNLSDTLTADFGGFTPGACDYVDVSGTAYSTAVAPTAAGCFRSILNAITQNATVTAGSELATLVTALTDLNGQTTPGTAGYNETLTTALNDALACGSDTGLQVSRLALCNILAVAFAPAGDAPAPVSADYQSARQLLQNLLQPPCQTSCPPYPDPCFDSDYTGAGRSVSLSVGPLDISGAVVLGKIGGVTVLANDTEQRFYFVCSDRATVIR